MRLSKRIGLQKLTFVSYEKEDGLGDNIEIVLGNNPDTDYRFSFVINKPYNMNDLILRLSEEVMREMKQKHEALEKESNTKEQLQLIIT